MSAQSLKELQAHLDYLFEKAWRSGEVETYRDEFGFTYEFKHGVFKDIPFCMISTPDGKETAMLKIHETIDQLSAMYSVMAEICRLYKEKPPTDSEILLKQIEKLRAKFREMVAIIDELISFVRRLKS